MKIKTEKNENEKIIACLREDFEKANRYVHFERPEWLSERTVME